MVVFKSGSARWRFTRSKFQLWWKDHVLSGRVILNNSRANSPGSTSVAMAAVSKFWWRWKTTVTVNGIPGSDLHRRIWKKEGCTWIGQIISCARYDKKVTRGSESRDLQLMRIASGLEGMAASEVKKNDTQVVVARSHRPAHCRTILCYTKHTWQRQLKNWNGQTPH